MQVILQESLVPMSRHPAINNKQVKTLRILVNDLNKFLTRDLVWIQIFIKLLQVHIQLEDR